MCVDKMVVRLGGNGWKDINYTDNKQGGLELDG